MALMPFSRAYSMTFAGVPDARYSCELYCAPCKTRYRRADVSRLQPIAAGQRFRYSYEDASAEHDGRQRERSTASE